MCWSNDCWFSAADAVLGLTCCKVCFEFRLFNRPAADEIGEERPVLSGEQLARLSAADDQPDVEDDEEEDDDDDEEEDEDEWFDVV